MEPNIASQLRGAAMTARNVADLMAGQVWRDHGHNAMADRTAADWRDLGRQLDYAADLTERGVPDRNGVAGDLLGRFDRWFVGVQLPGERAA